MRIRYLGGRSRYKISLNRKPYYFTPENNKIIDIQDKNVINHIFGLSNRTEFEVVMEEQITPPSESDVSVECNSNSDTVELEPKVITELKERIVFKKKKGRPRKGAK